MTSSYGRLSVYGTPPIHLLIVDPRARPSAIFHCAPNLPERDCRVHCYIEQQQLAVVESNLVASMICSVCHLFGALGACMLHLSVLVHPGRIRFSSLSAGAACVFVFCPRACGFFSEFSREGFGSPFPSPTVRSKFGE